MCSIELHKERRKVKLGCETHARSWLQFKKTMEELLGVVAMLPVLLGVTVLRDDDESGVGESRAQKKEEA